MTRKKKFKIGIVSHTGLDPYLFLSDRNKKKFNELTFETDRYDVILSFQAIPQENEFRKNISSYLKGSKGAVLLFDITNKASFDKLVRYLEFAQEGKKRHMPYILIATNADHRGKESEEVNESDIEKFIGSLKEFSGYSVSLFEISDSEGIEIDNFASFAKYVKLAHENMVANIPC